MVRIRPDLRDTAGDWFYWYFRVRGAAGRTVRFEFTSGRPLGVRGPGISRDHGETWEWLGAEACDEKGFTYKLSHAEEEVRFSFGMPYVESHWHRFLQQFAGHPALEEGVLCLTPKGRRVERVRLGCLHDEPSARVLIVARHHACEMMANYVIEGFIGMVLADDEVGRRFRDQVELMVIPFVDKDGVEEGDQGKNRRPHDHNRDYSGPGLYAETRAIRAAVPGWAGGRLRVALDLHCPWIRGEWNELIYQVGSPTKAIYREQFRLAEHLESTCRGRLPYSRSNVLPFGQAWNRRTDEGGLSFSRWAALIPGIQVATSFEIPYANAEGREVNAETARAFGRDLGHALASYLGII